MMLRVQSDDNPQEISPSRVHELSSVYFASLTSDKLRAQTTQRQHEIPVAVQARSPACINLTELTELVQWKLAHGKFRPALLKLAKENLEARVTEVTTEAFKMCKDTSNNDDFENGQIKQALESLMRLRGIGPATSSLLLSVLDPTSIPFFSDELFRFCSLDSNGHGWDRPIKYNLKEYLTMYKVVKDIRQRCAAKASPISALELEMAAYVLGRVHEGVKIDDVAKVVQGPTPSMSKGQSSQTTSGKRRRNEAETSSTDTPGTRQTRRKTRNSQKAMEPPSD